MLQKLLAALESANFKAALRKGRLACPACGSAPGKIAPASDDVVTCVRCGTAASALEWASAASASSLVGNADQPPPSTQITRQTDASGATTWNIPASGKSGGLMFFGIFWCTITAILSGACLFGELRWSGNRPNSWVLVLFFGVFWAIGIGMFYAACRSKYATHRLTAGPGAITLRRKLFGRTKEMSLPAESIQSVAAVEFYQRNYQPVHGIEIRSSQGKLRFGSMLTEAEKAWLVADLKRAVFGEAIPPHASVPVRSTRATRSEFFSVPLPPSPRTQLGVGLMLVAIGVAFILMGLFVIDGGLTKPHRSPAGASAVGSMFNFALGSFRVIWLVGASLFTVIGISLLIRYARARHHKTHLEGTRDGITLRTTRFGRIVDQRVFPASDFLDVRASAVGSSNGRTMKRIELLIGRKAHSLSGWIDGEKADAFVAEVRRTIFPPGGTL